MAGKPGNSAGKRRRTARTVLTDESDFDIMVDIERANPYQKKMTAGPSTMQELDDWPTWMLNAMDCKPALLQRMMDILRPGTLNTTDYSGTDCPREMAYQLSMALAKKYNMSESPRFAFVRSCDNAALPQKVLKQIAESLDGGRTCLSPDIMSPLDNDTLQFLDAMEPSVELRTSDLHEDRMKASTTYADMLEWLMSNRARLFPNDVTCECLVHPGGKCKLDASGRDNFLDRLPNVLKINWSGTTCKGWSSLGDQGRFCDMSEKTHAVWLTQRARMSELGHEDGFFGECTLRYPVEIKLAIPLEPWMHVVWIKVGPEKLGFPEKRMRVHSFGAGRKRHWRLTNF